jgi:enterochelin esterase-like enzyme
MRGVRWLTIAACLLAAAPSAASAATQPIPGTLVPNAQSGKPTADCPPRLNGDGTVTFYWCKPGATSVSVSGDWQGPAGNASVTLAQDPKTGEWSGTASLADGLHSYSYSVGSASGLPDPSNPPWVSELDPPFSASTSQDTETGSGSQNSEIFVPAANNPMGNAVAYDSWLSPSNQVRHGRLRQYLVSAPNTTGTFAHGHDPISVYLPPGYKQDCSRRYPTIYLLHGTWGNDVDWSTQGFAGIIEDNLLAEGKAKAAVIVMPNFNNTANGTNPTTMVPDTAFPEDGFREDLIKAYVPWVQSHFCVQDRQSGRAFAGLSQGADDTLNIIEHNATEFAYYGVQSPVCLDTNCPAEVATAPGASTIKCIQFGSGVNDAFASETDVSAEQADFAAAGIPNRRHMTPIDDNPPATPALDGTNGPDVNYERQTSHTWESWREQLRDELINVFFQPNPACTT